MEVTTVALNLAKRVFQAAMWATAHLPTNVEHSVRT